MVTEQNTEDDFDGFGLPEETAGSPLHNDEALVHHLRNEARSLGMLFGADRAVFRAALVAALPPDHRGRAIRLLGTDDPMFHRDPGAQHEVDRVSAVDMLASGVASLLDTARFTSTVGSDVCPQETIQILDGIKTTTPLR